jgi:predicted PhzF superfamily epimerase YddE/YHI9
MWLIGAGLAPERCVAAQGAGLGRAGHVFVERVGSEIWIDGNAVCCVEGEVKL